MQGLTIQMLWTIDDFSFRICRGKIAIWIEHKVQVERDLNHWKSSHVDCNLQNSCQHMFWVVAWTKRSNDGVRSWVNCARCRLQGCVATGFDDGWTPRYPDETPVAKCLLGSNFEFKRLTHKGDDMKMRGARYALTILIPWSKLNPIVSYYATFRWL